SSPVGTVSQVPETGNAAAADFDLLEGVIRRPDPDVPVAILRRGEHGPIDHHLDARMLFGTVASDMMAEPGYLIAVTREMLVHSQPDLDIPVHKILPSVRCDVRGRLQAAHKAPHTSHSRPRHHEKGHQCLAAARSPFGFATVGSCTSTPSAR